jgi:hypothetical protein
MNIVVFTFLMSCVMMELNALTRAKRGGKLGDMLAVCCLCNFVSRRMICFVFALGEMQLGEI